MMPADAFYEVNAKKAREDIEKGIKPYSPTNSKGVHELARGEDGFWYDARTGQPYDTTGQFGSGKPSKDPKSDEAYVDQNKYVVSMTGEGIPVLRTIDAGKDGLRKHSELFNPDVETPVAAGSAAFFQGLVMRNARSSGHLRPSGKKQRWVEDAIGLNEFAEVSDPFADKNK